MGESKMNELREMDLKIQDKLSAPGRVRQPAQDQQQRLEFWQRSRRFQALAERLLQTHIRPRLAVLAGHFANVAPISAEEAGRHRCGYVFGPTGSFAATARLALAVYPDHLAEQMVLLRELDVWPATLPIQGRELLALPLHAVDDQQVTRWVEDILLQFVDTYLLLERGQPQKPILRLSAAA
jgi:hypothetical protein